MFKTGDKICDRYRILDRPFAGGMAAVFPAEDLVTHDKVALKMLKELDDAKAVERFEREVIALTELDHPNIVRMLGKAVYPWAQNQTMTICVLEWIDGGMSLESLCYDSGCNLPLPLMLSLMYQVADAIAYAHGKEIIHRDIKPSNILLDLGSDGEMIAKVADFGTVKLRESATKLTSMGETLGTPLYMSPEQGLGIAFPPTVDVFSFWAMFYELVTNRLPYIHKVQPVPTSYREHIAPWQQIQSGELTLEPISTFNPDVPANLQAMIHRGVDREPSCRPSMSESAAFLKQLWEELSEEDKVDAGRQVVVPSSYPPKPSPFAATLATPASLAIQKIAKAKEERRTLFGLGFPSLHKMPTVNQAAAKSASVRKSAKATPVLFSQAKVVARPQLVKRIMTPAKQVVTTASKDNLRPVSFGQIRASEVVAEASQAYAQPVVITPRQPTAPQAPVSAPPVAQAPVAPAPAFTPPPQPPPEPAYVAPPALATPVPLPQPEAKSSAAMPMLALLLALAILGIVMARYWLPLVKGGAQAMPSDQAPVPTATVSQVAIQPEVPVVTASQPIPTKVRPIASSQPVAVPSRPPPGKGRPRTGGVNDGFTVEGLPPGTPPPPDNP